MKPPMPHPPSHGLYLTDSLRSIERQYAGLPLMQRAGQAAADWALALAGSNPAPILVLAGPGNNGGDAYVAATLLHRQGRPVRLVGGPSDQVLPKDAAAAREAFLCTGLAIEHHIPEIENWSLVIDGLFGIGLTRAPDGHFAEWIQTVNALPCAVLALDCPTGLNADTGQAFSPCIRASHTLTFIADKPGLWTADGPDHAGCVRVAELALSVLPAPDGTVLARDTFAQHLKPRRRNAHKGSFGSVGILGGATGMTGAALLAGRAALQLGAGRVYLGLLDATAMAVDPVQPELMVRRAGALPMTELSTLVIGPGLGQSAPALEHLDAHLDFPGALVLDADALNLLATQSALFARLGRRSAPTLLTPHPAEAARLLACTVNDIQSNRRQAAQELAQRTQALVVLKGCGSLLADADGHWSINPTGNPGMATAGMGDVLCGLIAALLAQHWPAKEALAGAVFLHGAAADLAVDRQIGPIGLTAGETIPLARQLLNQWTAGSSFSESG